MNEIKYGTLINRLKAIIIDALVLMGLCMIATAIFSRIGYVSDTVRMVVFIFIFLLYDPLFTSIFGATIGHLIIGLKIRRAKDNTRKLIFPMALIRFIIKGTLGFISLMTISITKKNRAIHDIVAGSVVLQA
jgi:uncharacterized RDD family membrane protein YckC